jgi:hypothetical protein
LNLKFPFLFGQNLFITGTGIKMTTINFPIPVPIKDFLFDLHEAVRRSKRIGDVQKLYEVLLISM